MRRLVSTIAMVGALSVPAHADVQFFFSIPNIGIGITGGGGYGYDYPPPPAYPPQYSPQAPIYGGYYYYKGDYPQPPPYGYPRYPGGVVVGGGGGYYDGYQGGYGYKKHRKRWNQIPGEDQWSHGNGGGGGNGYRPKPGCNQPPMCTGGKPWRPQ